MIVMALMSPLHSFDPKLISKAIFNNQWNDECEMRNERLYGSGYLILEIRVYLMEFRMLK